MFSGWNSAIIWIDLRITNKYSFCISLLVNACVNRTYLRVIHFGWSFIKYFSILLRRMCIYVLSWGRQMCRDVSLCHTALCHAYKELMHISFISWDFFKRPSSEVLIVRLCLDISVTCAEILRDMIFVQSQTLSWSAILLILISCFILYLISRVLSPWFSRNWKYRKYSSGTEWWRMYCSKRSWEDGMHENVRSD